MPPPPDGSESGAVREKSGSEARSSPLFVRQALISDGGLYLDHLLIDEDIPAWREESFSGPGPAGGQGYRRLLLPLHDDGAVVSYAFSGLTAEQVWAIAEETL